MRQAVINAQESLQQIALQRLASTEEAIKVAVSRMLHVDVSTAVVATRLPDVSPGVCRHPV